MFHMEEQGMSRTAYPEHCRVQQEGPRRGCTAHALNAVCCLALDTLFHLSASCEQQVMVRACTLLDWTPRALLHVPHLPFYPLLPLAKILMETQQSSHKY